MQSIDIPSQPLVEAITELGQETGLNVSVSQNLVVEHISPAVSGVMTPQDALGLLLKDTGLKPVEINAGTTAVTRDFVSQNARETQPLDLGTIVLRGELIERDLQDSQTSAIVVSGEDIEARGDTTFTQVINRTAGVSASITAPVIRGVRSTGAGVGGSAPVINTSLDGIRFSDFDDISETDISTWDLERVEILRGPQSTQTGRNALFGSILLESRDPQFADEARLRFGAGNFNSYQAALVANTVLIEDKLALRFSFDKRETDGFLTDVTGTNDRAAFSDVETYRLGLRYEPTDRLSTVLKYTFIRDRGASLRGVFSTLLPARISRSADTRQHDINSLDLEVNYDLTDAMTLSSNTIYTSANPITSRQFPNLPGQPPLFSNQTRSYDVFEQEFRLNIDTGRTRAVVGAFYTNIDEEDSTLSNNVAFNFPGIFPAVTGNPLAIVSTSVNDTRSTENYAIFGEIEFDVSSSWSVIAGARYDVEEFSATTLDDVFVTDAGVVTPIPSTNDGTSGNKYEAFLPRVGVVYRFDDDRSLGLSYQRGYRAGGSGLNLAAVPIAEFDFEPEFTDTVELAFRSQFYEGRTTLNANVFYTEWQDMQVTQQNDPLNPRSTIIDNVGSSRLWGAEVDFRTQVTADFEVFASAAYVDTEFGNFLFQPISRFFGGTNLAGNEFAFSPNLTAAFGGNYDFGNGWQVAADASYTGPTFSQATNLPSGRNDEYWLVNAQVSYLINDDVRVTGYVRNLFDEDYTTSLTTISANVGAPREFGVFVDARF